MAACRLDLRAFYHFIGAFESVRGLLATDRVPVQNLLEGRNEVLFLWHIVEYRLLFSDGLASLVLSCAELCEGGLSGVKGREFLRSGLGVGSRDFIEVLPQIPNIGLRFVVSGGLDLRTDRHGQVFYFLLDGLLVE